MNKGCLYSLIGFVVVVLLGAGGTLYYLNEKEKLGPEIYDTEQAAIGDVVLRTVANGSVQPRREVDIKSQISGIVSGIFVEAGDIIQAGDLVARIRVIPDMVSLSNAENRLERAKISFDDADLDFKRNAKLLESGVISTAEFQAFEIALRSAREELNASEDNLQIVRDGVGRRSGKSTLTEIRSTISGMVLNVPIKEGSSVIEANNFNEGTSICIVADMEDLIFNGKVDESEVEKLEAGMELFLTIGAIEDKKYEAVLEYISPKGLAENGAIQFEIRAAVQLAEGDFIRAGYSANANVVLDKRDSVLTISESVVQYDADQKPFVEIAVGENAWERRDVKLGLSDGLKVEVLEGLSTEEKLKLWNKPRFN
jgi:HlyD family secretion protein